MTRMLVLALILSIIALAVVAVTSAVLPGRRRNGAAELIRRQEDTMPAPFRTIAYGALILLLMGVVTGVIGGS